MGNREQLMDAAKKCLFDKGYERTTVRDIADLAGVSKAAIGYHFGSKEALLNTALFEVLGGGDDAAAVPDLTDANLDPSERFEALWTNLIEAYQRDPTFWLANLEAVLVAQRDPLVRDQLSGGMSQGKSGIAAVLTGIPEAELPPETIRGLGAVQMALMGGLMMQWLTDPDTAPSASDIFAGIQALAKLAPRTE